MRSIEWTLVGESGAMRKLRSQVARFAPTRLPVLIQGPTGSGKELVARALHRASGRDGGFVAFNVCAVSESMFEDTLFGHVRGAFTGAMSDRLGYLAEANGGTVFLDEISGAEGASQSKLLRAIETGSFRAVGAAVDRTSDFRVIAATNQPLDRLAARGRFRFDLLHRLSGVVLEVPPLSARMDDVPLLAQHFVRESRAESVVSAGALRRLVEHEWPGNVRELKHTVERAVVLAGGAIVGREHVEQALSREDASPLRLDRDRRAELDRARLVRVLMETGWDTVAAAARLGVHRATIYRRIRQFGITSEDSVPVVLPESLRRTPGGSLPVSWDGERARV